MLISTVPAVMATGTEKTPVIHYDFTGMEQKAENAPMIFDANKINPSAYPLRIDAGDTQKSRFTKVSDDIYAIDKQVAEFDARTYLRVVDSYTDATYTNVDTLFDGKFTFETWLYLPDATSLAAAITPLIYVGDASTYNLRIELKNLTTEDVSKGYIQFDRTFQSGGGKKVKTDAVVEYGKWNHIFISYDPSLTTNMPVVCINGEDISATLTSFAATALDESDTARTGANYSMYTLFGQDRTGVNSIVKAKWADIKVYDDNLTVLDAYNSFTENAPAYEENYDVKIYDASNTVVSGSALNTMFDEGNYIEYTPATGAVYDEEDFVIYDVTDDKQVTFDAGLEDGKYVIDNFKLTKNHDYKLYIKPIADADGNLYRTTNQVIEFKCTKSDEISVPYLHYDFAGLTKEDIARLAVDTKVGTTGAYKLYVDAGSTNKSSISTIADNAYAKPMSGITFANRTYLNVVSACDTAAGTKTHVKDMLDGAFTFETWIKVPDSTSLGGSGNLLRVGNASTYNLNIDLKNVAVDEETNKMNIWFDRTYASGGGRKLRTEGIMEYGVWNHIVISYNPVTPESKPVIVVNGVDYSASLVSFATSALAEDDTPRLSSTYSDFSTAIGQGSSFANGLFRTSYANIKFYQENLTAAQACKLYADYASPSAVPTPYASYNFNGLTKAGADKMFITNKVTGADATVAGLFVDASADVAGGNPSWIEQVDTLNLADKTEDNIWFKNNPYLQFKDGSLETSTASTNVMNVLDGAFTFEMWVNIPNAEAICHSSTGAGGKAPLLSYAGTNTWNLKIWPDLNDTGDACVIKLNRTMSPGSVAVETTSAPLTFGEWNHILVSYDATNPANDPMIVVNGTLQTIKVTRSASLTSASVPRAYTAMKNQYVKIGMCVSTNQAIKGLRVGDIKLYNQTLNAKQAANAYLAKKDDYTDIIKVDLVNVTSTTVKAQVDLTEELSSLPFAAIAVYDGTELKGVALADAIDATNKNVFTTGTVTVASGNTVKVFVMEDDASFKPVTYSKEFTIE